MTDRRPGYVARVVSRTPPPTAAPDFPRTRRRRLPGLPGLLGLLPLLVTACGATPKHPAPRPTATTTTTPSLRPGGSSKLAQYLLKQGEGGFTVFSVAVDQPTVSDWMKSSQSTPADARRVVQEGFHDALQQETATSTGGTGLDFVLELGSPAAARQEEAVELREDIAEQGRVRVSRFTVAGIPGSAGISASKGPNGSAANVLFTVGRCLLLVGSGGVDPRYRTDVIAGAKALYRRSATAPGPCRSDGLLRV